VARIPDALIERLKAHVPVQALAQARGVILRPQGADLVGRCPFHEDRTPSLVVTPDKNLWHCFGACQAGGTVIDWVMRTQGVSFRHAVQLLQNDFAPGLSPLAASDVLSASPSAIAVRCATTKKPAMDREDVQLLGRVIEYYHQVLLESPEALEYLKRRGIGSEETIRTFKLGFANRSIGDRLPQESWMSEPQLRERLQRLGILRQSGHEHFYGSIVVPVIDASGQVTEVYGRKINDNLRPGTPTHLYLPGPHRGVWNAAALSAAAGAGASASGAVILCEALIDALTFWCAGYRNVTASYGVEGFTLDHRALFKQCAVQRVLIAYDRDAAGDRAAQKLARQLTAEGIHCYRVLFPEGMDANEYALKVTPAMHSLAAVIRSAQRLGRGG
jgi:DNA primase